MKKFEEICEAYERHLTNSQGYKDRSIDFAKNLVDGFMSYCEIPKEQLKIQKVDEEREEDYHPGRLINLMEIFLAVLTLMRSHWNFNLGILKILG